MKQELMPVIAAYWGCECSYQDMDMTEKNIRVLQGSQLYFLRRGMGYNLKLHLRPLWSITEDELLEIGKIAEVERVTVNIVLGGYDAHKSVIEGSCSYGEPVFKVDNEDNITINSYRAVQIINYLRSKSFCVDQELIDNDLVQWI